jgi:hypothetical protein
VFRLHVIAMYGRAVRGPLPCVCRLAGAEVQTSRRGFLQVSTIGRNGRDATHPVNQVLLTCEMEVHRQLVNLKVIGAVPTGGSRYGREPAVRR